MFHILFTFYRNFFVVTGSISLVFCFNYWPTSNMSYVFTLFWMKIVTNLMIGVPFYLFNKGATIFYNNLGYSTLKMYGGIMLLDMLIWAAMMVTIFMIQ